VAVVVDYNNLMQRLENGDNEKKLKIALYRLVQGG